MNPTLFGVALCSLLCGALSQSLAAPVHVSIEQVPGQINFLGGNQGSATGSAASYSGFDASQFTAMYFGVNPDPSTQFTQPTVNFNGGLTTLSFASVQGTTAVWQGSAIADLAGNGPQLIPLKFLLTIASLGSDPWIDPTSVGLPSLMGAVIADPSGLDFTAELHFQADYGSGFGPLTPAPFGSQGGRVGSSVGFAFFVVRPTPEPSSLALAVAGFAVCTVGVACRKPR